MADVRAAYEHLVSKGEIVSDPAQIDVVRALDGVASAFKSVTLDARGFLSSLFRGSGKTTAPRGLYVHGGVGRGKTMLMDLFFETVVSERKRRVHFHEFMAEAHDRIARGRATTDGDPIPFVAQEIASEAELLCLDEMQVLDIADAMILGRLFKTLFQAGTCLVTTSNAEPGDLYKDGLNRNLFVPFIKLIESQCDVVALDAEKDYRLDKLAGQRLYFSPVDKIAIAAMDAHWQRLTGGHPAECTTLQVLGRELMVPKAAMGVARFRFEDLCAQPLGARDYLAIAHAFHTIMIDAIPILTAEHRNEARRFINLVDSLYDSRVCLIASAEAEPDGLYKRGDGRDAFSRTVSRLIEMRSEAYLAKATSDAQA